MNEISFTKLNLSVFYLSENFNVTNVFKKKTNQILAISCNSRNIYIYFN